jgi:hypothetical protein
VWKTERRRVWKTAGVNDRETYVMYGFPEKLYLLLGHGTNLQIKPLFFKLVGKIIARQRNQAMVEN